MKHTLFSLFFLCAACAYGGEPTPLLPDLIFDDEAQSDSLIDTSEIPGRTLFRFRTSLPNIGLGEYRLQTTGIDSGDGRETVNQIIMNDDDTSFTRDAGDFVYNPDNEHMEAEGWVSYIIRAVTPDDGVGEPRRFGRKASVRITSSIGYNTSLPNSPPSSQRLIASGGTHGISVGYTDIYTKSLDEQWIDITGLVQGEYWLELTVDADNYILESDETNNTTLTKVILEDPSLPESAAYTADQDQDDTVDLSELLRVIQFFNSDGFHCDAESEDGFAPGPGDTICDQHTSDYAPEDRDISITEVLRLIQFYNLDGYYACPDADPPTEDGYCPGPAPAR